MNNIIIRKETKEDYYATELMTMRAFWNIHGPGCNEHLLVNKLRSAEEYLPELSRVADLWTPCCGTDIFQYGNRLTFAKRNAGTGRKSRI